MWEEKKVLKGIEIDRNNIIHLCKQLDPYDPRSR